MNGLYETTTGVVLLNAASGVLPPWTSPPGTNVGAGQYVPESASDYAGHGWYILQGALAYGDGYHGPGVAWSNWFSYTYSFGPLRLGMSLFPGSSTTPRLAQGDTLQFAWFTDGYTQQVETLGGFTKSTWIDGNSEGMVQNPLATPVNIGRVPGALYFGYSLNTNYVKCTLPHVQFQDLTLSGTSIDTSALLMGTYPTFYFKGTGAGAAEGGSSIGQYAANAFNATAKPPYILSRDISVTKFGSSDVNANILFAPFTTPILEADGVTPFPPFIGYGNHLTTPVLDSAPTIFWNNSWPTNYPWDGTANVSIDRAWMSAQSPIVDPFLGTLLLQTGPPNGWSGSATPYNPVTIAINTALDVERPVRGGSPCMPSEWVASDSHVVVVESGGGSQFTADTGARATTLTRTLASNWPRAAFPTDSTYSTLGYTYQFDPAYEGTADASLTTYFSASDISAKGAPAWWIAQPDISWWRLWAHLRVHLDCPADMPANTAITLTLVWKGLTVSDPHTSNYSARLSGMSVTTTSHTSTYTIVAQPGASPSAGYDVDLMYPEEGGIVRPDRIVSMTLSGFWGENTGGVGSAVYTLHAMVLTGIVPPYLTLAWGSAPQGEYCCLHLAQDGAIGSFQGDTTAKADMVAIDGSGGDPRYVDLTTTTQYTGPKLWAKLGQLEGVTVTYETVPEAQLTDAYGNTLGPTPLAQWFEQICPYQQGTSFSPNAFVTAGTIQFPAGIPVTLRSHWPLWAGVSGQVSSQSDGKRAGAGVTATVIRTDTGAQLGSGTTDSQGYVAGIPCPADGNYNGTRMPVTLKTS